MALLWLSRSSEVKGQDAVHCSIIIMTVIQLICYFQLLFPSSLYPGGIQNF